MKIINSLILSVLFIGCVFENTDPVHIDLIIKNELSEIIYFSAETVYGSKPLTLVEPQAEHHYRITTKKIPLNYTGYPSEIISVLTVRNSNNEIIYDLHDKDNIDKYIKGVIHEGNEIPAYHWLLVVDSSILAGVED